MKRGETLLLTINPTEWPQNQIDKTCMLDVPFEQIESGNWQLLKYVKLLAGESNSLFFSELWHWSVCWRCNSSFLSSRLQPPRLWTISHQRGWEDKQRHPVQTPTAWLVSTPHPLWDPLARLGPVARVSEVGITQLLQFDPSIKPRPPSFIWSASRYHICRPGSFIPLTDEFLWLD